MKFLLDANFLMIPEQFRVDVFRELERFGKPELYTLDVVVRELESLKARLALNLLKDKGVKVLKSRGGHADEEIARLNGYVVCTQDRKLARKLNSLGVRVVTLRQGRYLVMKEKF